MKPTAAHKTVQAPAPRHITWSLRGGTYVPLPTASQRGLSPLDEDRAGSMTHEGGPAPPEPEPEHEPA